MPPDLIEPEAALREELMGYFTAATESQSRYRKSGDPSDLDRALTFWQRLLSHPHFGLAPQAFQLVALNDVGIAFLRRFERSGEIEDLKRSITCAQDLLEQAPRDWPNRPHALINFSNGLIRRFTYSGSQGDLTQAIRKLDEAEALVEAGSDEPDADALTVALRSSQGMAWSLRYQARHKLGDLDRSNSYYKKGLDALKRGSALRAPALANVGQGLLRRFRQAHRASDLRDGIERLEQASKLVSKDAPEYPKYLRELAAGLALRERRDVNRAFALFRAAYQRGMEIAVEEALLAARGWGDLASATEQYGEAARAYALGLDALDLLFQRQLLRRNKELALSAARDLPELAALAYALTGEAEGAAVALERGRGVLLREALDLNQVDLDRIRVGGNADLAERYEVAARRWNDYGSGEERDLVASSGEAAGVVEVSVLVQAQADLQSAISAIRSAGYSDFLGRPDIKEICRAASLRPLIYLVPALGTGFALIVEADRESRVDILWLPDLANANVSRRFAAFRSAYERRRTDNRSWLKWLTSLDSVAGWLGRAVMDPLIKAIPRVEEATLIPGGLLGLLPLHAAWTRSAHKPSEREYAIDQLRITYAPSARALEAAVATMAKAGEDSIAAISMPSTAGEPELRYASVIANVACGMFPLGVQLDGDEEATVPQVLAAMKNHPVHHFDCHAYADTTSPLSSGLILAKGEILTVRECMRLRLAGARLAVLSACDTGVSGVALPDEMVSLATALLQAGIAGIVASLWAVAEVSTALLMFRFYIAWRNERVPPAQALRLSQTWLRDSTTKELLQFLASAAQTGTRSMIATAARQLIAEIGSGQLDARPFRSAYYWGAFAYTGV